MPIITERILFQNEACIVINKIAGESSEAQYTVGDGEAKLFPVHRIDVPVTGCFLLAREKEAASFLSAAFSASAAIDKKAEERLVRKYYWAIVEMPADGNTLPETGTLLHWVCENHKLNKAFAVSELDEISEGQRKNNDPKKSMLHYRVVGKGERYLFLEIELVSGRHHQIRAQLAAIALHIKGDLKYGAKRSEKGGGIRLHAHSLSFPNPLEHGKIIKIETLPPVMDALWDAFKAELDKANSV